MSYGREVSITRVLAVPRYLSCRILPNRLPISKRGYEILERNYRCRRGEVDLVARDGGVVVFVEVKARTSDRYGDPELAVDLRKQRKISIAALDYLVRNDLTDTDARFDVVVIKWKGGVPKPELIRNAFDRTG